MFTAKTNTISEPKPRYKEERGVFGRTMEGLPAGLLFLSIRLGCNQPRKGGPAGMQFGDQRPLGNIKNKEAQVWTQQH